MTSIAEKYAAQWLPNGEVSLADLIQAAVDEAQSVPVVGGLFDLEKLESLGWQIAVCQMCGTHASAIKPAAELATLREKAAQLEHELETECMRLVACGVIALSNTADSAINSRDMLPEYWSASAQDCASAVDREMDYRSRLAVTERERDELRKALQKACIGLAHASEANPLYQKNYEACEKALMALAQGKGE